MHALHINFINLFLLDMNALSSKNYLYTPLNVLLHLYIYAGTSTLLSDNPDLITSADIEDSSRPICRKDTGQKKLSLYCEEGGTLTAGLLFSNMTIIVY